MYPFQLDNADHYMGKNGELVQFYVYGSNNIAVWVKSRDLQKELIRQVCKSKSITLSEDLLNYNYCLLQKK